jgi:type VI secretion system secreted protein VgrG
MADGLPWDQVYRVEAHVATGDGIDVRHFQVSERMSSLFEVRLVAVSENPDIDFEAVIGQPMSFVAHGAEARSWVGLCSDLRQVRVEENHLSTYELTLVPTLWLATQRRNFRMFQHLSELDIALQLLGEWGVTPTQRLTGQYKKRKYRLQYGETDYAFICRMLEDAGVSFYFDNLGESGLVLDDGPQSNAARAPIVFFDRPNEGSIEYVTEVRVARRLRPGKYTVRDHDYRRPATYDLVSSAAGGRPVEEKLERFHYVPGAFLYESQKGESTPYADDQGKYRADEPEGEALAQRRLEAQRTSAREVTFKTNALDLAPGTVLSFLDHPKSELGATRRLLVVESTLTGDVPGQWLHACTAVSGDDRYRPALITPKPRAQGVESATVVGPPGQEIHVDEFGRVRVQFHWN